MLHAMVEKEFSLTRADITKPTVALEGGIWVEQQEKKEKKRETLLAQRITGTNYVRELSIVQHPFRRSEHEVKKVEIGEGSPVRYSFDRANKTVDAIASLESTNRTITDMYENVALVHLTQQATSADKLAATFALRPFERAYRHIAIPPTFVVESHVEIADAGRATYQLVQTIEDFFLKQPNMMSYINDPTKRELMLEATRDVRVGRYEAYLQSPRFQALRKDADASVDMLLREGRMREELLEPAKKVLDVSGAIDAMLLESLQFGLPFHPKEQGEYYMARYASIAINMVAVLGSFIGKYRNPLLACTFGPDGVYFTDKLPFKETPEKKNFVFYNESIPDLEGNAYTFLRHNREFFAIYSRFGIPSLSISFPQRLAVPQLMSAACNPRADFTQIPRYLAKVAVRFMDTGNEVTSADTLYAKS